MDAGKVESLLEEVKWTMQIVFNNEEFVRIHYECMRKEAYEEAYKEAYEKAYREAYDEAFAEARAERKARGETLKTWNLRIRKRIAQ